MRILWIDAHYKWADDARALKEALRTAGVEDIEIIRALTFCDAEDQFSLARKPFGLLIMRPGGKLGILDAPGVTEVLPYADGYEFLEWHAKMATLPPTVVYSEELSREQADRLSKITDWIVRKPFLDDLGRDIKLALSLA